MFIIETRRCLALVDNKISDIVQCSTDKEGSGTEPREIGVFWGTCHV